MKVTTDLPELLSWLSYWNGLLAADWKEKGYTHGEPPRVGAAYCDKARRIRVWFGSKRSAAGFIDVDTGDIYYAATFSRPAKHVRGNLFSETGGREAIGSPYGIRMLR